MALEHDPGLLSIVRVEKDVRPKGMGGGRKLEGIPKLRYQWRVPTTISLLLCRLCMTRRV